MLQVITNANVVTPGGVLYNGCVVIKDGRIADVLPGGSAIPGDAQVIDARGVYVGPGFVDIHVHGACGHRTFEGDAGAVDHFLRHGTTTLLATPAYSMDFEGQLAAIAGAKKAMEKSRVIKGIYMEGPYTNPKYGANADRNPWRHGLLREEYTALADACGNAVRVWAVAPELEGISDFLAYARKVNPAVVFSVGHSEATPMQIAALGDNAPTLLTHAMNATGRIPTPAGTRGYGPDEYCFMTPGMYAELISDSLGIHVHPCLQQMLLRIKGVDKVVLITDSTAGSTSSPEEYAHITDLNFDHNGDLAGSRLTMDMACRNIMTHTGCSMAEAFTMASLNPAKVIGLDKEIGSVEKGKLADLVFVDENMHVLRVMSKGEFYE